MSDEESLHTSDEESLLMSDQNSPSGHKMPPMTPACLIKTVRLVIKCRP